jgi:hypothetical protein
MSYLKDYWLTAVFILALIVLSPIWIIILLIAFMFAPFIAKGTLCRHGERKVNCPACNGGYEP